MDNLLPILIAVLGAGGFGAFFREIVAGVVKFMGGMSARESKRSIDIVQQRDEADARAEDEAAKRRAEQEHSARLTRQLILAGIEPDPAPVFETTITKAQLRAAKEKEKP